MRELRRVRDGPLVGEPVRRGPESHDRPARFPSPTLAQRLDKHPEHWPKDVGRYWLQAHKSATDENWDAAAVMTRSALQIALRQHEAKGNNLNHEIDDLAAKGVLPPHMKDWAHELRDLGNDSAHPEPSAEPPTPQDVRDVLEFLDFLLEYPLLAAPPDRPISKTQARLGELAESNDNFP